MRDQPACIGFGVSEAASIQHSGRGRWLEGLGVSYAQSSQSIYRWGCFRSEAGSSIFISIWVILKGQLNLGLENMKHQNQRLDLALQLETLKLAFKLIAKKVTGVQYV